MKVHNLYTANMQSHHPIHGGHVSVGIPFSSIWIQIQVKTKNFISNYGYSLKKNRKWMNSAQKNNYKIKSQIENTVITIFIEIHLIFKVRYFKIKSLGSNSNYLLSVTYFLMNCFGVDICDNNVFQPGKKWLLFWLKRKGRIKAWGKKKLIIIISIDIT